MRKARNDDFTDPYTVKYFGIFLTLIGLGGVIGGLVSCHVLGTGIGDDTKEVARVNAAYAWLLVITFGAIIAAVGFYIISKFTKPN
jgi:hypothetical protein